MSRNNDWDFQIETAQSLYRVMAEAGQIVNELNIEIKSLVDNHQDLMAGNYRVFVENYVKPIYKGLTTLSSELIQLDMPTVKKMIVGLHKGHASIYGGDANSAVQVLFLRWLTK